MSIGPMGTLGSAAGSQLAQGHGSDVNRAQQDTADHTRQTQSADKAEAAGGVGQTEQDEGAADRDADGRRLWESTPEAEEVVQEELESDEPRNKDPTGQKGGQLDLSG